MPGPALTIEQRRALQMLAASERGCTEPALRRQGFTVGSIALIGWALGSAVEGLASVIVVWRFTGERTLSDIAERRAQQAVAVSFWLLAPFVAVESVRDLLSGHHA